MIKWLEYEDKWSDVMRSARSTISREGYGTYPSDKWKKTILQAEHSPIRKIKVSWKWSNIKSWVSVHLVRHWLGIIHFVTTQRSDRTGVDRDAKRQDALVEHECEANAQAIINISRRRLCTMASPETRSAWKDFKSHLGDHDPVLASVMVRECVYRGFCPEFNSCGYVNTDKYKEELKEYRKR